MKCRICKTERMKSVGGDSVFCEPHLAMWLGSFEDKRSMLIGSPQRETAKMDFINRVRAEIANGQ